jgi:tetratricopeptide repeat protein
MIEPLLEAERLLSVGLVDQAERLYRSVAEHDPGSSIALVGLARVALERGDDRTAYVEARRALAVDPENPAAQHMVLRLEEVIVGRGESIPGVGLPESSTPAAESPPPAATPPPLAKPRSVVDRLLRRGGTR